MAARPQDPPPLTVYTIGHSNTPASDLIARLKQHAIQVVYDVRSAPYSRFSPQYNKENLARTLSEAGIVYAYAGDQLGGRPKDPTCYTAGVLPQGKPDSTNHINYALVMEKEFFRRGVERLLAEARERRVAVMCAERDPARCHRHHLIGRYLAGHGVAVLHILGDGGMVSEQQLEEQSNQGNDNQLTFGF